jgi:hypothetical protein
MKASAVSIFTKTTGALTALISVFCFGADQTDKPHIPSLGFLAAQVVKNSPEYPVYCPKAPHPSRVSQALQTYLVGIGNLQDDIDTAITMVEDHTINFNGLSMPLIYPQAEAPYIDMQYDENTMIRITPTRDKSAVICPDIADIFRANTIGEKTPYSWNQMNYHSLT